MDTTWMPFLIAIGILIFIILFLYLVPIGLWFQALVSGATFSRVGTRQLMKRMMAHLASVATR